MFCVIQEIQNKKANSEGKSKELTVGSYSFGIVGQPQKTKYTYEYNDERFERPIKTAYKISIHHSYRENGQVKKKQWHICTMGYYDFLDYWYGDFYHSSKLEKWLDEMEITEDEFHKIIGKKYTPLEEKINKEFKSTEEYKTDKKHKEILDKYRKVKAAFEEIYGENTYDYVYDVFGELRNQEYLDELHRIREARKEQEKRSYENFYQSNYNNNSNYDYSSYFSSSSSTYTDDEKKMLKKIYKVAALKFHPDITNDNGEMMKFLTKLKEGWGI
ncbi:hypothetical protein AN964_14175 [Heyndrickxia shackletonii]|uniref:J domain-containing protein n=1 Tax=Heyndrickxia shackletonii TaxID=157838 RepID=A0A0Q3WXZ0_9BACI|nr:hypothetical protein [Heyndrickxia shackletonii]KQL54527.1 hypothetical protein AN964_14175 [Heyndrickxia shackletonii]NEZ02058.1 hypothetical protein [Heyndrickxia shackletonii]